MKNSNIIISIIIVLGIAIGVTAYGLINPDDNVFTSLPGFNPEDSPTGDDGQNNGNGSGGSGFGAGGSGNNGFGSNGNAKTAISASDAIYIANNHIAVEGCYAGKPRIMDNGNWYVPVMDSKGNIVDGFEIDSKSGKMIGKA